MNSEEAKFILSTLRTDQGAATDREVAEALERAQSDPALAAWLAEHRAFDQAVIGKLREVTPPPTLKSSILAGIRISRPLPWWRRPATLAIAASVAIMAAVPAIYQAFVSEKGNLTAEVGDLERFRTNMIGNLDELDRFDFASADRADIMDWLSRQGANTAFQMPDNLKDLPTAGCRVFDWEGRRASLICFRATGNEMMPTVHLVILEDGAGLGAEAGKGEVVSTGEWSTAIWREGSLTFLLASKGGAESVRKFAPLG